MALVGSLGPGADEALTQGLTAYHALCEGGVDRDQARRHAARLLEELAARVVPAYLSGGA